MKKVFRNIFLFCLSISVLFLFTGKTHAQVIDTEMSLDTTFNFDISSLITNYDEYQSVTYTIDSFLADSNNRTLIAISYETYDGLVNSEGTILARLNSDGSLDNTFDFDETSYFETIIENYSEYDDKGYFIDSLAIDSNSKVLVSGYYFAIDSDEIYDFVAGTLLIRLNSNGSYDNTFSFDASSYLEDIIQNYNEYEEVSYEISSLVFDSNNKVFLSAIYYTQDYDLVYEDISDSFFIRLNTDGSLDSSFNLGVFAYLEDIIENYEEYEDISYVIYSVGTDSSNRVLLRIVYNLDDVDEEYESVNDDLVIRLNTDGTVDDSFDFDISPAIENYEDYELFSYTILSIVSDPNKNIYFEGTYYAEDWEDEVEIESSFFVKLNNSYGITENIVFTIDAESYEATFQNDGKMIVSADVDYVDGWIVPPLFRLSPIDSLVVSDVSGPILDFPQTNGEVYAMALSEDGSILYIGGDFTQVDGIARNYLAAINTTTYAVTDWNPNPDDAIHAIDVYGDSIYIGGEFNNINSVYTGEFAKINSNGTLEESCDPNIHQLYIGPQTVYAIKATEEYIYVGGSFAGIGTFSDERTVTGLVRLENTNSCTWDEEWTPLIQEESPNYDLSSIYSIEVDGEDIYVGGAITHVNETNTGEFAKIDQEGNLDESCMPNIHTYQEIGTVYSIETDTNHIYIGGDFDRIGEETVQGLIRLNKSDCSRDLSWNPSMTILDFDAKPTIYSISVLNNSVFVGGSLSTIQNQITEFARLSKTTALADPLWNPQIISQEIQTVYSSLVTNDYVYIGGAFNLVDENEINNLAVFNLDSRGPSGNITINLGKQYTDKVNTSLTLYATDTLNDVSEMNICNNSSFTGCSWEVYGTSKSWILDSSLGLKTVYVKFKDAVGNISETYSDTTILHTPSVRITEIGLVKDLADKSPITVYFTSTSPLVKGVSQSGSSVYFVYDGKTYSTVADSSGNFSISLDVSFGTNTIQYYSKDMSDNQSATKILNLIVGTQYFPESLLISMGLMTPTEEQEGTTEEEQTPDIPEEDNEEEQQPEEEDSNIQTLQFLDKEGNPLVGAFVTIDGTEYFTDSKGEIQVIGLENGKKYKVKVEHDGVKYTSEVLGASGVNGSISVTITEEDISKGIDWKKVFIYSGIGLGVIFFFILIFKKKRS